MKVTKTATITESLQNCCLHNESGGEDGIITGMSSTPDDNNDKLQNGTVSGTSLELNSQSSHVSLPYNWEHCLDLKTGEVEVHLINKRDGAKATEDPRTEAVYGGGTYSESDEEDDDSWYDSDESSSESSSSRDYNKKHKEVEEENDNVLVVGGCKRCYMYFMVPKKAEGCPKCNGQLLRFDRSQITSPSSTA